MKCAHFSHHSEPTIWINYSNVSARAEYLLYLPSTPKTLCTWSSCACSWTQSCALTVATYSLANSSYVTCHQLSRSKLIQTKTYSWLEPSECPEISARSLSAYRPQIIRLWTVNQVYRPCDRAIWTHRARSSQSWAAYQVPQLAESVEAAV